MVFVYAKKGINKFHKLIQNVKSVIIINKTAYYNVPKILRMRNSYAKIQNKSKKTKQF